MTPDETILWKGSPSQLTHARAYLLWLLAGAIIVVAGTMFLFPPLYSALLIPGIGMWIRWWITKSTEYELTTQRLRKTTGLFSKKLNEIELYRVKDTLLDQPFFLRVFGAGNIKVVTSDVIMPEVTLTAVRGAYNVREKLRKAVEDERDRKRVRDVEFSASSPEDAAAEHEHEATDHDAGAADHPGH